MRRAIIGGTGFYEIVGGEFIEKVVHTPYGDALVHEGEGEHSGLIFLARHGKDHTIPPHRINYRANLKALEIQKVESILAVFTVGSLRPTIPPKSLVLLDQFLDFTSGREATFFDGGRSGLAHAEVNQPYCSALRKRLIGIANSRNMHLIEWGTYVCTNGPRFETPAEIRMFAALGGDVVGMTGVPEVSLARELGIHYAAIAIPVNWGAGLETSISIVREGMDELRASVIRLCTEGLQGFEQGAGDCECRTALMVMHPADGV
ncbi:MAG: S-methyl-5'-thioinosine phosphorylase [Chloroflexi bacterium]|nr:S-methyl-5'-thioinosine phosphorylase [Chloroflexota bacterium]